MIGLIVAIIMLICKVKLDTVLLAFIGFQLFALSEVSVSKWRQESAKRRAMSKAMEDIAKGFKEAMRHENGSGRVEDGCRRREDEDGK